MEEEIIRCTADLQNKIYEAGLFRPEEKVVLATKGCVLLEHFTGKTYSYRMVDLTTLKAKRLFSRQKPLTQEGYERAIEKMLALAPETPVQEDKRERAETLLAHVFTDILPRHGMALRENQLSLALSMLDAIWDGKVALCEAEVGTGKTHAYSLSATVYRLFNPGAQAVLISTSTIALQRALTALRPSVERRCAANARNNSSIPGDCTFRRDDDGSWVITLGELNTTVRLSPDPEHPARTLHTLAGGD